MGDITSFPFRKLGPIALTKLPNLREVLICSKGVDGPCRVFKDEQEEEAIDGLERLINLYPENYLCEKAY